MLEMIIKNRDLIMVVIIGIIYLISFIYYMCKNKDLDDAVHKATTAAFICLLVVSTLSFFFPSIYNIKINDESYIGWDLQRSKNKISFVNRDGIHSFRIMENIDGVQKSTGITIEYYPTGKCHLRGL